MLEREISAAQAEQKRVGTDKKLLVGVWEVAKRTEGGPPVGATVEFTSDGKFKITGKIEGEVFVSAGTYTVEGAKLTLAFDDGRGKEKQEPVKVKKLTEKELLTESEGPPRKVVELRRTK
jgi:uncharacterized protein (TIGR03066 family)